MVGASHRAGWASRSLPGQSVNLRFRVVERRSALASSPNPLSVRRRQLFAHYGLRSGRKPYAGGR